MFLSSGQCQIVLNYILSKAPTAAFIQHAAHCGFQITMWPLAGATLWDITIFNITGSTWIRTLSPTAHIILDRSMI